MRNGRAMAEQQQDCETCQYLFDLRRDPRPLNPNQLQEPQINADERREEINNQLNQTGLQDKGGFC